MAEIEFDDGSGGEGEEEEEEDEEEEGKEVVKDARRLGGQAKVPKNSKKKAGFLGDNSERLDKNTAKAYREFPNRFEPPRPLFKKLKYNEVKEIIDGADAILEQYEKCRAFCVLCDILPNLLEEIPGVNANENVKSYVKKLKACC